MSETFSLFVERVPNFDRLSPSEKICHAAWFLHQIRGNQFVSTTSVNGCFNEIHAVPPHTSVYLRRLSRRKPPIFIASKSGYRLENGPRRLLEEKYGTRAAKLIVPRLLADLSSRISNQNERAFLDETLRCYGVEAFRATIVMAWNLAYDHLQIWLLKNPSRLSSFNASLSIKYPKKTLVITSVIDLADLKEFEAIETFQHTKLLSKNTCDILREKLKRRNAAAHPSAIKVTQAQADDVVTDLVNNVILPLGL